jgi:hypothetical protein
MNYSSEKKVNRCSALITRIMMKCIEVRKQLGTKVIMK